MAVGDTLVGVLLAIAGGTIASFGFVLQKKGHNEIDENNDDQRSLHKDPTERTGGGLEGLLSNRIWWLGLFVYHSGSLVYFMSLNYAAITILSALSSVNLVTNAIFAYFILKEPVTKAQMVAIGIIIIGIILIVIFGPQSQSSAGNLTVDDVRILFEQTGYIVIVSLLTGIAVIDYVGVIYYERKNWKVPDNDDILYGRAFLMFSYTELAAFFAANNVMFIKAGISAIVGPAFSSRAILEKNASDYLSYLVLVLFVVGLFLTEYFRQKALAYFGALYVVPLFSVSSIILTMVIGGIYFQEFDELSVLYGCLFGLGIVIVVIGVALLTADTGKLLKEFDDLIRVAFVDSDEVEYGTPKKVVYGGVLSERYAQHFFNQLPLSHSFKHGGMEIQLAGLTKSGTQRSNKSPISPLAVSK